MMPVNPITENSTIIPPVIIARQHEREVKRFLVLSAINYNSSYTMIGPVDQIWHTFILFTEKYHEFCNLVAGRILHHLPSVPSEGPIDFKRYAQLLEDYKVLFGEEPSPQFWPRPQELRRDWDHCGCVGD